MNKNKLNALYFSIFNQMVNFNFFIRKIYNTDLRKEINNNRIIKSSHKNKHCFIIGNGPSITGQDLTLLRDEFTFVVNSFILHEKVKKINPKFYCMIDPKIWNGSFPLERFLAIEKQLPNITIFFRYEAKKFIESNGLFKNHKIHYIYDHAYLCENYNKDIDASKCMPSSVNVILSCIMLAMYMGFSTIYLIGCDSTLLYPKQDHFYEEGESNSKINDYAERMEKGLYSTAYMFTSYRILRDYCKKLNVNIFNATDGGILEVFPRLKFESIINS